ncbi:hypothetical protein BaRGS_00007855 [Batillaria attramentaria]|uniref:Uncharacterized protein n=1 Tax=Batillaria attramentaria TaxID=370345 RepID=A0ABD0LN75_9CAEN
MFEPECFNSRRTRWIWAIELLLFVVFVSRLSSSPQQLPKAGGCAPNYDRLITSCCSVPYRHVAKTDFAAVHLGYHSSIPAPLEPSPSSEILILKGSPCHKRQIETHTQPDTTGGGERVLGWSVWSKCRLALVLVCRVDWRVL